MDDGTHTTRKLPEDFVLPLPQAPPLAPAGPAPPALGHYALVEELGRGGMGSVWRARDRAGREVALKVLAPGWSENDLLRFQREAALLRELTHEGIVQVLDWGIDRGTPFLVMELIAGESLERLIARTGPVPPRHAAEIARDMARAMAYAHEREVLHRDLKPGNVLLDPMGRARLVDFGLARRLSPEQESQVLTQTGVAMGTPATMAPEQARAERELDGRTDVYGIGATLFWALTGRPPFQGKTWITCMRQAIEDPPPRPTSLQAGIDPRLEAICLRCLEKDPAARFQGARELSTALSEWLRTAHHTGGRGGAGLAVGGAGLAALVLAWLVFAPQREPLPAAVSPPAPAVSSATPSPSPDVARGPAFPARGAVEAARRRRAQTLTGRGRLPLDPVQGWLDLARLAAEAGQADERARCVRAAEQALQELAEPGGGQPERLRRLQARILAERGEWGAAALAVLESQAPAPLTRLGELFADCPPGPEGLDQGIQQLAAARLRASEPMEHPLALAQAVLLAEAGRAGEAIACLTGVADSEQLTLTCMEAQRYEAALAVSRAGPDTPVWRELQARALEKLGRWDEAWQLLDPLVQAAGTRAHPSLVHRLGLAARYSGRYEQAERLLRVCGDLFNLGGTLASMERYEEAAQVYAEADGVFARFRRVESLIHLRRLQEVEEELSRIEPSRMSAFPEAYLQWIALEVSRGNEARAAERLEEIRLAAEDPWAHVDALDGYRRAGLYWAGGLLRAGRLEQARALLTRLRADGALRPAELERLERDTEARERERAR